MFATILTLALALIAASSYAWIRQVKTAQIKASLSTAFPSDDNPMPKPTRTATFLAVGDIMLSRTVAKSIYKQNRDPDWPFSNIWDLLQESDFNFGNLESPYSGSEEFNPDDGIVFNAPPLTAPGLANHNFKVLNLANNHILDQGPEAITFTNTLLGNLGISTIGAGQNLAEAWIGTVQEVSGIKIGFLGATYGTNIGSNNNNYHVANIQETKALSGAISELKKRSDFIVVTMHAGTEYTREITDAQKSFAKAAIDGGADMVIGSHPHWVQGYEEYKGKYIFYSLGNFVFDQEWSRETKEALALKITLEDAVRDTSETEIRLKTIQPIPIIIENYGQPRPATEEEKIPILRALAGSKKYFWE